MMAVMTAISPDVRLIPTRRMSFAESLESLPKHFAADGDLLMSHVLAVLSGVFPDGEDYFVRSVRHFRSEITDPVLKRQVAGFIGQEAIHGREHRALNDRLAELGYSTKRIERFTRKGLAIRGRVFTPTANLAATAALEHFTATLAEVILSNDTAQHMIGAPEIRDVLLWHALEESEHKAVAFDVFKAIGAAERTRRWTMNFTTVVFLGGMSLQAVVSMLGDRATYQPGVLRASARRMKANPFFRREVWRNLRDYNRADFHPDDHDTEALLDEWRERLFGSAGTLNDRLAPIA